MIPRRSLRIRQLNSRQASNAVASANATSKPIGNAAKKRTHSKSIAEADATVIDGVLQPKPKRMKLNSYEPIAPILHLPVEVLEKIFGKVDDFGLVNLADTCTRFESIAIAVASKKYAQQYVVINSDDLGGDRDIYEAIFNRFGIYIYAIEVNRIEHIGAKHWMTKLLRPHIHRIQKLKFHSCTFNPKNIFSQIMHKITHLTMNQCEAYYSIDNFCIDVMKCRKLVKLELRGNYRTLDGTMDGTLKKIMLNNPGLQSIIYDFLKAEFFASNSISGRLKQLKEVDFVYFYITTPMRSDEMDRIIHTLRNLESLGLCYYSDEFKTLQRLGMECTQIKRLELYLDFNWDGGINEAVRSFKKIQYLHLKSVAMVKPEIDKIQLLVRCLPHLRQLRISIPKFQFNGILPLLRECPSLDTIIISLDDDFDFDFDFVCVESFKDFLDTLAVTGQTSVRIEIKVYDNAVATITAKGIVCRNKLMHWAGCETILESLNTNLLDLAHKPVKSDVSQDGVQLQMHLLDRIFDYLDITSLYLFADTNPRSKQLVENYIKMHSKQNGLFTMTNEFYSFCDNDHELHRMFTSHVTNLKVYNYFGLDTDNDFLWSYDRLTKVSIFDDQVAYWCFPRSIEHVVLDGSEFYDLSELYKLVNHHRPFDVLELKNASSFNGNDYERKGLDGIFHDSQLKSFLFNYRSKTQFNHIQRMFKGSKTKLVPIYPNSSHFDS